MGLIGYEALHTYCAMRLGGDDLSDDPLSWEATSKLMTMGKKTLQRIIDLIFKLTSEMFDMGRFPSQDCGPWDKLIREQDLAIAIQQRYVAAKESIEMVLEHRRTPFQTALRSSSYMKS